MKHPFSRASVKNSITRTKSTTADNIMKSIKKEYYEPYIWRWETGIEADGTIIVDFVEKAKKDSDNAINERCFSTSFTAGEIMEEIRKTGIKNRFAQIQYEGHLASINCDYMTKIKLTVMTNIEEYKSRIAHAQRDGAAPDTSDIGPQTILDRETNDPRPEFKRRMEKIAKNSAILAAFRSSIAYTSPYGGGTNSVLNLPEYIHDFDSIIV